CGKQQHGAKQPEDIDEASHWRPDQEPARAAAATGVLSCSALSSCSAALTRSRSSLPGLKWGTYLPCSSTDAPVLGLRPTRGARKCREKLPKPRISIRPPSASALAISSIMVFTANSTSRGDSCVCRAAIRSINSDLVNAITIPRWSLPTQGATP